MTLTGDKALGRSVRTTKRAWPAPYPKLPFMSRQFRIKLLIASLAANLVLGLGIWWYAIERPCQDEAQLADAASGLANLDREIAVSGFTGSPQGAVLERRAVLLAAVEPVLRRLGERANPELVGIVLNAYQQQGDYAHTIQFGTVLADSSLTPLSLRLNTYRVLGHAYLSEVGGSISEVNGSFASALDLIQENDDPKSKAVASGINMEWGNVLMQAGQIDEGFSRLLLSRQDAVTLACGFPDRSRLMAMVSNNLSTIAAQDSGNSDRLQKAIVADPDFCGR